MLGRWLKRGEKHRADEDPRGGLQSEKYRTADPRDVVEQGGTAMAAPGGTPQEDTSPDERRAQDRP